MFMLDEGCERMDKVDEAVFDGRMDTASSAGQCKAKKSAEARTADWCG